MKQLTFLFALAISFCSAQTIEKFSIDNGGASVSAGGLEVVYTIGEVNIQERVGSGIEVSEGFISANTRVLLDAKVFLQGPILSPGTPGLMDDDLRLSGYLPTTSLYPDGLTAASSVFNAGGTSGTGLAQDDIVDWIYVEIRQGNDNSKLVRAQSCLLQRDGDIVDADGVSSVVFNAAQTSYYIVVKHRNHLGAMSDVAIGLLEASPVSVDFTNNAFNTFGSDAQVLLGSGDMALWTGDADNSGSARFSGSNNDANVIKDYILADPGNGFNSVTYTSTGYLNIDVNMDGNGRFSGSNNDSNIIKDNVLAHPGNGFNSSTYVIQGTIPPITN
ncbi:MAG: hemagglutinin protein [Bacteroidia bacterium]|nr:hemagglutinin protein [Bacteroidia bacterium]